MGRSLRYWFLSLLAILSLAGQSCKRDIMTLREGELLFSSDTVFFDSLFTGLESPTQRLIAVNPHDYNVLLSGISLENGDNSPFRLIIDGIVANSLTEFEIEAGDSIYLFIEYSSDLRDVPVRDKVVFRTDAGTQTVQLDAFVIDAVLYQDATFQPGTSVVWTPDKRYLIDGNLLVEEGATLQIQAGTRVYFTPRKDADYNLSSGITVNGTLRAEGAPGYGTITFQGSRWGEDYAETPGQWRGLTFGVNSKSNILRHVLLKNGLVGMQINYNVNGGFFPKVRLEYSQIRNMAAYGIAGVGYSTLGSRPMLDARNSLIHNCQEATFVALGGGYYTFKNCTFANYDVDFDRKNGQIVINNYDNDLLLAFPTQAEFRNCIIWGTEEDEYVPDTAAISGIYDVQFHYTVIRSKLPLRGSAIRLSQDEEFPVFATPTDPNPALRNYRLRDGSAAISAGQDISTTLTDDLDRQPRVLPFEAGCYEYR